MADVAPLFSGLSSNNIGYVAIINRAITDPRYAETQRRTTVKDIQAKVKTAAELKKDLDAAVKAQKANQKEITKEAQAIANVDSNADGIVNAGGNQNALNAKIAAFKVLEQKKATLQKSITSLEKQVISADRNLSNQSLLLAKLDSITGVTSDVLIKGGTGNGTNPPSTAGGAQVIGGYVYNIPMMRSAYFASNGLQSRLTDAGVNTPAALNNAQTDSFNNNATRGAIQMNAETAKYLKEKIPNKKGQKRDPNAYGFAFHYNPTAVQMSYGTLSDVSPELLQYGEGTKFNPITPLGDSKISFTLYLNRIDDLSYITEDGLLQMPEIVKGTKIIRTLESTDLYPVKVLPETLKEIYKKGTMYDLEFLFRAVHSGSNDYTSALRGKTSDIGWIAGIAVECHLGKNLRFLGRIDGLSVNHFQFNERMVPTLTTVGITVSRFYDIPAADLKRVN
jgi:hypothetical protein